MIKLYNGHGDLLAQYNSIYHCCKEMQFNMNTIYTYFKRNPTERSYGIFEGSKCSGRLKYIIVKEESIYDI